MRMLNFVKDLFLCVSWNNHVRSALFCLCVIFDLLICVYWTNKLAFLDQTNLVMACDFLNLFLALTCGCLLSLHLCWPGSFYLLCFSLVWGRAVLGSWSEFAGVPSLPIWGTVEELFFRVLLAGSGYELLISSRFNLFRLYLSPFLNNRLKHEGLFLDLELDFIDFNVLILPFPPRPCTIFPPTVLFPHDGAHLKKSQKKTGRDKIAGSELITKLAWPLYLCVRLLCLYICAYGWAHLCGSRADIRCLPDSWSTSLGDSASPALGL